MLIPSVALLVEYGSASLSRRVNANSQRSWDVNSLYPKLIKKGEC